MKITKTPDMIRGSIGSGNASSVGGVAIGPPAPPSGPGQGIISSTSNAASWQPIVSTITAGGTVLLGPNVAIAAGSNIALSVASNTATIHATLGPLAFGSNANDVSSVGAAGASALVLPADHVHRGVTAIAHSSNTLYGTVTLITPGDTVGITSPSPGTLALTAVGGGGGSGLADQGTFTYLDATEAAAPATPAAGKVRLYVKADGLFYSKDDAGSETGLSGAGGGGSGFDLDTYSLDATYGDDFTAASLNTTLWTRRNFAAGAESYQVGKVGTYIRIAMTGRAAGDGYLQTAPGGDWTFAMAHINRLHGEHTWGVCVLNSVGTGLGTAFADSGGGVWTFAALGITTYTTYSGAFQVTGSSVSLNPTHLRHNKVWQYLRKSGTDYFAAFSLDGETWSPETPAFSSAITVDRVGMLANPQAALTTTAQVDVDWFNKIA